MLKKILIFLNLLLSFSYAASDLYNNEELKDVLNSNMYEPNYLAMLFGLFLVIGLVYLTSFVYQKLTKINLKNDTDDLLNHVDVISTTSIGQNKNIHVIKVNNEYLLIASTQTNINFLKELKQPNMGECEENE